MTIPSQDIFEHKVEPYARSGLAIETDWSNETRCAFIPQGQDPALAAQKVNTMFSESILLTTWPDALAHGCDSFTEVAKAALEYAPTIANVNFPPMNLVVMAATDEGPQTKHLFNPDNLPGLSSTHGRYDGPVDGMILSLVSFPDLMRLRTVMNRSGGMGVTTVLQEPGPWNHVYLQVDGQAFKLFLFFISLFLFLHNCYRLAPLLIARQFSLDIRNVVFLLALLAAGLIIPVFLLRDFSFAWYMLGYFVSLFGAMSLKLLLLLWTNVLKQMYRKQRFIFPIRLLILFSIFTDVFAFIGYCISLSQRNQPGAGHAIAALLLTITILNAVSSIVTTGIFFLYSMQFLRRGRTLKVSPETHRALSKLTYLAWGATALYFLFFLLNVVVSFYRDPSPAGLYGIQIVKNCLMILRIFALLGVLGLRVPNKSTTVGSSAMEKTTPSHSFNSSANTYTAQTFGASTHGSQDSHGYGSTSRKGSFA